MKDQDKKWEVLGKVDKGFKGVGPEQIVKVLLKNRGVPGTKKEEFFNPREPKSIKADDFGIDKRDLDKAKKRIQVALKRREKIIVYGDYDADGVCATAIMWETLFELGADVLPYIPDRFEEGYGLNSQSVRKVVAENPKLKLIVTVDNGIVANEAVEEAKGLGVDTIITDHHQKGKTAPQAFAVIYTDKASGSGISWFFAREILGKPKNMKKLELAAIGTIADQMPLMGVNRSVAKYGLEKLGKTQRMGLVELFKEAGLYKNGFTDARVGTYEVSYIIAPRLNAMGRLEHAIDSLRLICTNSTTRARRLAQYLSLVNQKRQKIVEDVLFHARELAAKKDWKGVIVLSDKSYHEGVIGLAAGKLVEEFGRPALVISEGKKYSKGSARSIPGFNIIEAIRQTSDLLEGAGGHPMAAGFRLRTEHLAEFEEEIERVTKPLLTAEILQKKLKVDMEIDFSLIDGKLYETIRQFEPTGLGNPGPSFVTRKVRVVEARTVGSESRHLKLKLEKKGISFEAIGFGLGGKIAKLRPGIVVDVVFNIDENVWNGYKNLQLKLKDIHFT
jgi:single-stranded-DNA-specific exonuclease